MFWDLMIVFFAASGIVLLLWCFIGAMLHPVYSVKSVTFLPVNGDGECLEQQARAFAWLREGRNTGGRLVLVDCGLSEQGMRCAQLLCKKYAWITVCETCELEKQFNP